MSIGSCEGVHANYISRLRNLNPTDKGIEYQIEDLIKYIIQF